MQYQLLLALSLFSVIAQAQIYLPDTSSITTTCAKGDTLVVASSDYLFSANSASSIGVVGQFRVYDVSSNSPRLIAQDTFFSRLDRYLLTCADSSFTIHQDYYNVTNDTTSLHELRADYGLQTKKLKIWKVPLVERSSEEEFKLLPAVLRTKDLTYYVPHAAELKAGPLRPLYVYVLDDKRLLSRHSWQMSEVVNMVQSNLLGSRFFQIAECQPYFSLPIVPGVDQLADRQIRNNVARYQFVNKRSQATPSQTNHVVLVQGDYAYSFGSVGGGYVTYPWVGGFSVASTHAMLALKFDTAFNLVDTLRLFAKFALPITTSEILPGKFAAIGPDKDLYAMMNVNDIGSDSNHLYIAHLDTAFQVKWQRSFAIDPYQNAVEVQPISKDRVMVLTQDIFQYADFDGLIKSLYFVYILGPDGLISSTPLGDPGPTLHKANVYPNPVVRECRIGGLSEEAKRSAVSVMIYDAQGKHLGRRALDGGQAFEVGDLPAGAYFGAVLDQSGRPLASLRFAKQ